MFVSVRLIGFIRCADVSSHVALEASDEPELIELRTLIFFFSPSVMTLKHDYNKILFHIYVIPGLKLGWNIRTFGLI